MVWTILIILPYSVIIFIAWIKLRRAKTIVSDKNVSGDSLPRVSVIVAAKNEENCLPDLISDLKSLDYPKDKLEILIVDDHSSDSTAGLIQNSRNINYFLSKGRGKKQAIATGLEYARGELILTTDADCSLKNSWLRSYAEMYILEKPDLIIGQVKPERGKGLISVLSELEFYSLQAVTGGLALVNKPVMCNGANLGFRKAAVEDYLKSVKADIASGDDMFLLHTIKKSGGRITWLNNDDGTVSTRLPHRLRDLFRQRSRWAGKSIYFTDSDTIAVAISTLIANLSIIAAIVLIIINPSFWPLAIALFLAKTIPEFILLSGYLKNPAKLKLLLLFLPASIIYPFYVLITVIISIVVKRKW
ncbi:MAG: glycosyltransferase [Bacteroidales bacterium]|nr:glycosyltransferase [Bacteroidales bacterium]